MTTKITKIGITKNKISGRGGISLYLRYIENIGLFKLLSNTLLSLLNLGNKGLRLEAFLKQIFAFFIDGTDMSISSFDTRKKEEGYAAVLENNIDQMASSHQIKRFFLKMSIINNLIFNKILNELFVWRLNISKPTIIELGIDTMVMDNDDAKKREGNEPTYKKKKGFQPLHICWGPFLIDVLFRKGSAHSNHGTDYIDRVKAVVKLIRKRYSQHVPIIICADSGFADQKAYNEFEADIGIHYITTSKIYGDIKQYTQEVSVDNFGKFSKNKAIWSYIELGSKLKSWSKFRRCIFTRLQRDESGQCVLDFAKPNTVIYTNIGMGGKADAKLKAAGGEHYFQTETIIQKSHERGADELIHRSIKELATKEQLPFKRFGMNRAYYFMLVISHVIFEAHKQDVTCDVMPITSYPNTFRRKLIDFAVKITSGARMVTMRVTQTVYETIDIALLWQRCKSPPHVILA